MPCRLFLSISLAAAAIFEMRKLSGNQMIFAVSVTAGTCRGQQRQRNEQRVTLCEQSREKKQIAKYLFANVEQRFVELFVNSPEDMKVQCVKGTNDYIFIPLVDLWWFTCTQKGEHWGKNQAQVKSFRLKKCKLKKKEPTNFGLNIGEDIAYIEGKLLGKGSVFGNGDSIARIIKSLLYTRLKVADAKSAQCSFCQTANLKDNKETKQAVKNVRYSQLAKWNCLA